MTSDAEPDDRPMNRRAALRAAGIGTLALGGLLASAGAASAKEEDDFDLDIRLGQRWAASQGGAQPDLGTRPDTQPETDTGTGTGPSVTVEGSTCVSCASCPMVSCNCATGTCASCQTNCNQATCANTCQTCQTNCNQGTCANTCQTCNTNCHQDTCSYTCGQTCQTCHTACELRGCPTYLTCDTCTRPCGTSERMC